MASRPSGAGTVVFYSRFSSDQQNPRSCEAQERELEQRAARDGLDPSQALRLRDEAISGQVFERPGLQELVRRIEAGEVRTVYVEAVDRLSRDPEDAARLMKLCTFHGCEVIALSGGGFDGSAGSALMFGIQGALAANYIRELGAKTKRGLRDSARNGKATGGRCYGFRTNAESKAIEIDETQAAIVRDMFELYASGHSYAGIAAELNRRKIEAPRSKRRASPGWQVSSVRAMLRNPKYAGTWTFGGRTFKRHPTSRKRKALRADPAELVTTSRPNLRVVPEDLWTAVQARLAQSHAAYTKPGARVIPNPKTDYLLSGVLRCAECGSLMEIMRGSHASYYRCSANRRRGAALCSNRLSVREDVAKGAILSTLSDRLWNPETLLTIRETVAREAGAHHRQVEAELKDRTARLTRVEQRLRGLVEMQLDGDTSETVRAMRADHEAQAAQERHAVDHLRAELAQPVRLPSPWELSEDRILGLDALHEASGDDVAPAREQLKSLLDGQAIRLHPKPADPETGAPAHYVAEGGLLPLGLLIPTNAETPHDFIGGASRDALRAVSCAGRI